MATGVAHSTSSRAAVGPSRGRLVLVDTDRAIADRLVGDAADAGIDTTWCRDGAEALLAVGGNPPNTLVLHVNTDTVDAAAIVSAVRGRWRLPILVGSDPGDDDRARRVLAAGASAVIARPYRIDAIVPFVLSYDHRADLPHVHVAGPIEIDSDRYETRVHGRDIQLTQRELELLTFLVEQRGRVVSAEEISEAVWGHVSDTNTVAVHVKRLREKLGVDSAHGEFIRTIRGAGYRLAPSMYA